jgi:Flp pilus assembly pilin Flp
VDELQPHHRATSAQLDELFQGAETLDPNDRLRLIARLWASLPETHWAAPSEQELALIQRQLNDFDTDGLGEVPWRIIRQMTAERARQANEVKIYSAPRRFDLATIFVVTSAYSIFFALLSGFGADPWISIMLGGFITLVGIGQAILFGGKKPRAASIITGATVMIVASIAWQLYDNRMRTDEFLIFLIFSQAISGVIAGYIAGVLVGGVFLVADAIRRKFTRSEVTSEVEANASHIE